jgi:reactive intermediate/imine deaminase
MIQFVNPFPAHDPDRHQIWEMLVKRDIEAFISSDWNAVAGDFIEEGFMGIDARSSPNPDSWKVSFPDLESYKHFWLEQSAGFTAADWEDDPKEKLLQATTLRDIDISGNSALVHKKFDGAIRKQDGTKDRLNWQSLYRCRKLDGQWKIAGFTGFLPHPAGPVSLSTRPPVELPENASQHATAGPYSPVLKINPGQLVVISGQAALDQAGETIGDTIEDQARVTLENCRTQLESAGSSLKEVFKVNVYLKDIGHWPHFNEVYREYFTKPLPVRAVVQAGLLYDFLVEIEMWAVRK